MSALRLISLLFFLSSCAGLDINKSININLAPSAGVSDETNPCSVGYLAVPITINYYTTSEQNLKDLLKSKVDAQGLPGF